MTKEEADYYQYTLNRFTRLSYILSLSKIKNIRKQTINKEIKTIQSIQTEALIFLTLSFRDTFI